MEIEKRGEEKVEAGRGREGKGEKGKKKEEETGEGRWKEWNVFAFLSV